MRKLVLICSVLWIWTCGGDGPTEPKIELPTVQNIEFTLEEDTSKTFAFMGSDPLNRALTYSVSTQPQHGTLTINAGAGTYAPYANYHGADTFAYIATNVDGTSNIGTIVATVTPVDDEPNSMDVSATTDEDNAIDITLEAEEYDGDNIIFQVRNNPYGGSVTISEAVASYTPNPNWNGTDTFNFEAVDSSARSVLNVATATITVNPVNDAPSIENVNAGEAILNESIEISLSGNDIENDNLTFSIVSQPSIGTVVISGAVATYTATETGGDSFTYQANDGRDDSNIATITTNNVTLGLGTQPVKVIQVSDGGFVFGGFQDDDSSNFSLFLAKIDNNGTIVWSKVFDENYDGDWFLQDMIRLEDDSLILLGTHQYDGSIIINVDTDGNVLKTITSTTDFYKIRPWGSRYNGDEFLLSGVSNLYILNHLDNFQNVKSFNNNIQAIDATTDSLMIVSTQTNTGSHFYKLNPNSTEIWNMGINLSVGTLKIPSVLALPDGDVVVAGHETNNSNTLFYGRIGSDGNLKQSNTVSNGETTAEFLEQAHDGGFISTGKGSPGLNVLKTDAGLNQEWYKTYNLEGLYVEGTSILKTIDGGYIISGVEHVKVDNEWKHISFILKIDSEGNQEW